jgi:hypothetical protein
MLCTMSQAQNNTLFVPVSPSAEMSTLSKQRSDAIAGAATTGAMDLVRVNIAALESTNAVISLPGLGAMRADRRRTKVRSPRDYTWIGEMQVTGGAVLLVVQDGQVTGSIMSGLDQFSVTPIGDGVHAIVKIDHRRFPPDHPPGPLPRAPAEPQNSTTPPQPTVPRGQRGDAPIGDPQPAGIVVDIMITWTNEAAAAYGGSMPALAQLAIDAANIAYTNSNANVELRLVSAVAAGYSEAGQTFVTMLDALTSGSEFASVRSTRDLVGADMVALIAANGSACGRGWIDSSASTAFTVTNYSCAVGNHSFAHELGHNFGARHDPFVDPTNTPYPYGHGYVVPSNAWRTVMAYVDACGSCPRLQYFSNPSVLYQGTAPMGTAATHDNARVHRERVATVAAFRAAPATPALSVTPAGNFASSGIVGGPFSPSSTSFTVQNSGTGTMNWSASSSNTGVATVSPTSGSLAAGGSTTITVQIAASATSLAAGSYSSTISFTNLTNGSGNTTRTATLTVNNPGSGGVCTDAFSSAPTLSGASGSVSGSNVSAAGESGEPDHASVSTPLNSVWCKFTAASTGTATFTTVGSNFDTTLAAYTGSSVNALTVIASNDDTGGATTSAISFMATAGTTYYIAVDGFSANMGNYTLNYTLPSGGGGGGQARFDFNGDGTSDILWHNASTGFVGQFRMSNGVPTWSGIGSGGSGWSIAGVGDFNGDGTSDILWYNASSRAVGQFRMSNGVPTWAGIGTGGSGWSIAGTGDYNGGGTADILWYNSSSRAVGMFRMANGVPTWVGIGTGGAGWSIAGSGDFNGDGTTDILWYHASSSAVGMFRMANGVPTWVAIGQGGAGWTIAGTGDFNGDGTADILWYNASSGAVGMFRMSTGVPTWVGIGTGGSGWSIAGTGDYNGDGTADILWHNASSRAVGMFRMANGVPTWVGIGTGGAGWSIAGNPAIVGHPSGIASASE